MKTAIHKNLVLALGIVMIATTSCKEVFQADFNTDTVGSPPSTSPAGSPADDAIAHSSGNTTVIHSSLFTSNALEFERGSSSSIPYVEWKTGAKPHGTTAYTITFKAYSVFATNPPILTLDFLSSTSKSALHLQLYGGQIHLISGDGDEVIGNYHANKIHNLILVINTTDKDFGLIITQEGEESISIQDKPLIHDSFSDLDKVRLEYPPAILEAFEGRYVIDDITISKKK